MSTAAKPGLHPRNRHLDRYDFQALVLACPGLAPFVRANPLGEPTIDFADPRAVRWLNRALLAAVYGVEGWDIPEGFLCPPIPGRADHLHHLAGLLPPGPDGQPPRGPSVRVLDIGVGASCVYPLLGRREYGWSFLGTDIDPRSLASAQAILRANPGLAGAIELRLQQDRRRIFEGVVRPGEAFELCLCNPPFHPSQAEARRGTERKWRNLGRAPGPGASRNFGGQGAELWCPGGEAAFIAAMAEESAARPGLCRWFTSLVSRSENLPGLQARLRRLGAAQVRVLAVSHGQKQSRILAWTFELVG